MSQELEGAAEERETEVVATETNEVTKPSRAELLKEVGFENVEEDSAFDRLYEAYKQQLDQTKTLSEQVQSAIEEIRASRQQTETKKEVDKDGWWDPPDVDLALLQRYKNADGSWKDGVPGDIRTQGDAAQRYYDKWADDLVRRPNEVLPKIFRQEAEKVVRELLGQSTAQQKEQTAKERILSENDWLFEKDPITGRANRERLTTEGELLNQHFMAAEAMGLPFEAAWDYAYSKHQLAKLMAKQGATKEEAQEINEQKKKDLLGRATGGTQNRGGSLPPGQDKGKQANKNLSIGERLKLNAAKNGIDLNTVWN